MYLHVLLRVARFTICAFFSGNHFYQFFLLRTDRYNKKLKKYYVEIEELDEDMEEEEELEREEEREAYLLFMCYIITCLYPWFPT